MKRHNVSPWVYGFLLCFFLAAAPPTADAQQVLPLDQLTNGPRVLAAFAPVIEGVRGSVVEVRMDDKRVALGLVLTEDGLVVTKASELDALRPIAVRQGNDAWPAKLVGGAEPHDLALLQVSHSGWPLPPWQNGDDPEVGRILISPGLDQQPLAIGVVSVSRRTIEKDPVHGILGVQLQADRNEAVIENMFDGSAAIAAGLQVGDSIVKVGTVVIGSRRELIVEISKHAPGETVILEVHRQEKTVILSATLTHPFGDFLSRIAQQNRLGGEVSRRASGFPAVIQHDSVLKPEYCGGPIVNLDGRIVGVNIARSGRTESLLIPTSVVRDVLQTYREGKLSLPKTQSPTTPPPPPSAEKLGSSIALPEVPSD